MNDFVFYNPAKIIFGKDAEKSLGKEIKQYGSRVLLHYGGGSIFKNGVYEKVKDALESEGFFYTELGGVLPNPRLSLVHEGIRLCRKEKIDFILAVGGGSSIDSAKAIAAGVHLEEDVFNYFMDRSKGFEECLPIGVVLTIAAAGSESSTSAVITRDKDLMKRGVDSKLIIPKFAILNPENTFSLPAYQAACGVSDIIAHLMERYFTNVTNVDFSDRMIEGAIKTMLYFGPLSVSEPDNYDARAEIMWTGTIAHNGLLDKGRLGDWASHHIEHELSALYDIAHGAGLSIVFPAWMKYVYKENIHRFIQFATRVMDVDFASDQTQRTILHAIEKLEGFYKKLGLPIRLSDVGITSERFEEMADKAMVARPCLGQFKKLYKDDIIKIYELAK